MRSIMSVFFVMLLTGVSFALPVEIKTEGRVPMTNSASTIFSGSLDLPSGGHWELRDEQAASVPVEIYLRAVDETEQRSMGRRMRKVETNRNLQRGRHALSTLYWAARTYASTNSGQGPASMDVLPADRVERTTKSPWYGEYAELDGPFVFLVPNAQFHFREEGRNFVPRDDRVLLAFELRPFVDDGKHWVLYTDGASEREDVDLPLIKKYGQEIRPVTNPSESDKPVAPEKRYSVVAVFPNATPQFVSLQLYNDLLGQKMEVVWRVDQHVALDPALQNDLASVRKRHWQSLASITESSLLAAWYGDPVSRAGRGRRTASVFGVLGGRPAIEETLQMGLLRMSSNDGERTISLDSIEGVTVKSHPYGKMLGDTAVTPPALLQNVPADHLVLHVPNPKAMLPFLDGGADFIGSLGTTVVGRSIQYDLKDRYLARLGVNQDWLEQILQLGVVREFAIFAPDLFLIDGTDLTIVSQIAKPAYLSGLFKIINIGNLGEEVVAVGTQGGRQAFWAMRGDKLVISTSESEMALALRLMEDPSASLAESEEYQYMLTQVPLQDSTRMMLYFSDPFIRRLVSPKVKIGQLRRARARATMEYVTASILRANLDGLHNVDIAKLVEAGYLAGDLHLEDFQIAEDGRVVSDTYGSLAQPVSLSELDIDKVTPSESAAYQTYLDNYNRFWRQFFDPIAIRVDDMSDGGLAMTTFILPLIDNSLYDNVKSLLVHADGTALRIPTAKPDPVLMLSLNLAEPAWTTISEGFADMFMRYIFLSSYAIDDLGPAIHFAIYDADPVIALGSGDILGAFGGDMQVFRRGEMFAIPMALSVLTRPCAFMIETRDAARTARFLDQAATSALHRSNRGREVNAEFYRIDNENAWVYSMSVFGMINLRFGIRIEGDYVVIRNIPWSSHDQIVAVEDSLLKTASLAITPSACVKQLPGLHATAMEKSRYAAIEGIGRLYPLMVSQGLSVEQALEKHSRLFGFRPVHPGEGNWQGDVRTLRSSDFGTPYRQQQPAYRAGKSDFGLFHQVEQLRVSMAFENTGLRSIIQWKLQE